MSQIIHKQINESSWGDSNGKRWEDYDTIKCPDGQVIDMVKLIDDQHRAKAALIHLSPIFGGFVGKLRWIYTFRVQTQATDGYNLFINPQFTYNLSLTEKCFVMAHEVMHCLLNHMRRGKGHNPKKSNIAADYEVNISLSDDLGLFKFDTIKNLGALIDKKYLGWGYEKIYADNPSSSESDDMDNSDQSKDAEKNQQQNGQGSGSGGDSKQQYSEEYKKGWKQAMEDYKKGKLKF